MLSVPDVGVWRNLLCTTNGILVDAEGKMQPPVHAEGAWRGRKVPKGDFCPQNGYLLWMPKENASSSSHSSPKDTPYEDRSNSQAPYMTFN